MRGLDELLAAGVSGRRVLVRADLNTPLSWEDDTKPGAIGDDGRIRASLRTIRELRDGSAKVIVCAHLGRPKGKPEPAFSLEPVAERLAELLGIDVLFATDTVGVAAHKTVEVLADGEVALLENVRFDARETSKDAAARAELAAAYAELADIYVDDAFGAVHRAHASVFDIAERLPAYAGRLVEREVDVLQRLTTSPRRPYVVALGGSKVSDKLAVINALLPQVDQLVVGGGMCFTFLKAQGYEVGNSLLEADLVPTCATLLERAGDKIVLPTDIVTATEFSAEVETRTVAVDAIESGTLGLDIGPASVRIFAQIVAQAGTVFWNGPMGVFELAPFAAGTKGLAQAIADSTAFSVVGGGDSAAAVRALGIDETAFSHISTGGGASLEYLEGKSLPGLAVLAEE